MFMSIIDYINFPTLISGWISGKLSVITVCQTCTLNPDLHGVCFVCRGIMCMREGGGSTIFIYR